MATAEKLRLRSSIFSLTGERAKGLIQFHDCNLTNILTAKGSSCNHQAWEGGYCDHLVQCFLIAQNLYKSLSELRELPFTLESAIVVLYLHDIEKIFKYGKYPSIDSMPDKQIWYKESLSKIYKVDLTSDELNALKYIHGEGEDYKKDERVMCPLAAFCHSVDILSARVFYDVEDFLGLQMMPNELYELSKKAVGKRIKYIGTNGNEFDKNYGTPVEGEGLCSSQHDSHGLCLMVKHDDCDELFCLDPTFIEIL